MEKPIISVSGLRGIVGKSLDPILAMRYVTAFIKSLPNGPIVVTRDGRCSGPMLASAINSCATALGRDVYYGDVAATPTVGVIVRSLNAAGGIQISASHNPPEYNGLKLFGADGRVIPGSLGQQVIEAMDDPPQWKSYDELGRQHVIQDTTGEHLQRVLATVDVDLIQSKQFKVVLDSNHGAGSVLGKPLLNKLCSEVHLVGGTPNGKFAHPPEPTRENLSSIAAMAGDYKADVVFCQDPDADRLAIIDDQGHYVGEEYTLAITLKNRLQSQPGPCVINCATSRMSIDIAKDYNCTCHVSAVGEANVCDEMLRVAAVYGGEGNGGPIDPRVGFVRDSFVAMAQVLEMMAKTGDSIRELINGITRYSIVKSKTSLEMDRLSTVYETLKDTFPDASASSQDGLRLDWPNRWLLVRPSNTEPIVRIICEATTDLEATKLAEQATQIISQACPSA